MSHKYATKRISSFAYQQYSDTPHDLVASAAHQSDTSDTFDTSDTSTNPLIPEPFRLGLPIIRSRAINPKLPEPLLDPVLRFLTGGCLVLLN